MQKQKVRMASGALGFMTGPRLENEIKAATQIDFRSRSASRVASHGRSNQDDESPRLLISDSHFSKNIAAEKKPSAKAEGF